MSEKPKVYVVVTGRFGGPDDGGDVAGSLMHADGSITASHCSSNLSWLQRDLTVGFKDRREALEARYPDGFDVEVVNLYEQDPPEEIAQFFVREQADG